MILYHGSNVAVSEPKLMPYRKALDFGNGFYLTSDFAQAERWAKLKAKREGSGIPMVYIIADISLPIWPFNYCCLRS